MNHPATTQRTAERGQQRGADELADVPRGMPKVHERGDVGRSAQRAQAGDTEMGHRRGAAADHGSERPLVKRIFVAERHGHEQRAGNKSERRGHGLEIRSPPPE